MQVEATAVPDVKLVRPVRHRDARGWFLEAWNRRAFAAAGIAADFVQDNRAGSAAVGTVRGLHFQIAPHAQGKLVHVLKGAVFDVAVDIRRYSATFGRHVSVTLTAESGEQLWVPPGFAHGYCTLTPDCEVGYRVSDYYAPQCERGLLWNDPALGIAWPVAPAKAIVNPRDGAWPVLADLADLFEAGAAP
ncbi:MAG TPA: dTDP-4-dehydrorhamnose 3,5-epimerase [Candidatus Sulfotelmatobacter sp.]|nr:dTDP-4-dehydrorhamnose 3,5-epimerase [Candidatus Sulfotelmatobacter sp.]